MELGEEFGEGIIFNFSQILSREERKIEAIMKVRDERGKIRVVGHESYSRRLSEWRGVRKEKDQNLNQCKHRLLDLLFFV